MLSPFFNAMNPDQCIVICGICSTCISWGISAVTATIIAWVDQS